MKTEFNKHSEGSKTGFTIIELLVATVIFTVVLIIMTYGIISISRTYYKGVTTSQTQNAARNIANSLAQAIKFDGTYTYLGPGADIETQNFCIGNQLFSYLPGYQLTGTYSALNHTTKYSFLEGNGSCSLGPQSLKTAGSVPGVELMGKNMRLAATDPLGPKPVIQQLGSTGLYTVDIRVVYGDPDLLNNPTASNASCKLQTGSQFCSVSELQTTVARRIE